VNAKVNKEKSHRRSKESALSSARKEEGGMRGRRRGKGLEGDSCTTEEMELGLTGVGRKKASTRIAKAEKAPQ